MWKGIPRVLDQVEQHVGPDWVEFIDTGVHFLESLDLVCWLTQLDVALTVYAVS